MAELFEDAISSSLGLYQHFETKLPVHVDGIILLEWILGK
jgi:hypothetical protein